MPHLEEAAITQWRKALTNAHKRRLDASEIEDAVKELADKSRASSDEVVEVVLDLRMGNTYDQDPLVIRYVELLLRTRCIVPSSLLLGLLKRSRFAKTETQPALSTLPLPTFEEKVFHAIRALCNDRMPASSVWKLHGIVFALTRWLNMITEYELAQQLELGPLHTINISTAGMYESLAMLAYTVFGNQHFREIERQPWWKERRALIAAELTKFDINVLRTSHSQMSGFLHKLIAHRPFLEVDDKGKPILSREQILAMPEALPILQTRGGLFIWLTSCLAAQPYIDDSTIRNYLLLRYHEDAQNAALALILAAFDVLINSAPGQGTPHLQKSVRSFICNRLPLLLSSLSTLMQAGALESCISMALMSIELGPVTPLGTTTAETKEIVKKTKLEFLQVCVLYTLLTEASAASILPGQTIAVPKARYNRVTLLSQCTANITRLDALALELETMNGNVGPIAGCIADLITTLCNSKDTMTLKSACAILLKRVSSLRYAFQFVPPANITIPLCQILNDWTHDQDQTEFQPVFEEFAVILLFLVAVVHSNDMTRADLGLSESNDNFAAKFLFGGVGSTSTSDLSEEQSKQLFNWIQGLYATDESGDTLGITDEVYSQCSPQAFYGLVPTLFEQTTLACKCRALTIKTMTGGLEFLLEPFLLPSLIGGINWIADTTWTDAEDTNIRLHMLEKLLKSSSASQEVQTMHKAILAVVARPLEASLQVLQQNRPDKRKEAAKLLEILTPYTSLPTVQHNTSSEQLNAWSAADGGLVGTLRSSIRGLAVWSANGNPSSASKYSPAVLWETSRALGTLETLMAIVAEVQNQTIISNGPMAIDLTTAMVCAPTRETHVSPLSAVDVNNISLRDYLRLLIADQHALLRMPYKQAEALIRLSRSVESQSGLSQLASQLDLVSLSLPTGDDADQVMQDLGLTATDTSLDAAAAAAALGSGLDASFNSNSFALADDSTLDLTKAAADAMIPDATSLDPNHDIFGDLGMDLTTQHNLLGTNGVTGDQGLTTNAEDDIFADLDMGNLGDDFEF